MNTATARFNMIEQQVRPWEVLDGQVLDLLGQVPREDFVPKAYRGLAFADIEIPLGDGQSMLSPKLEGRILQALRIQKTDHVLQIGTGSGYLTALLAKMAEHVISVDTDVKFNREAAKKLESHGIYNVKLENGDAMTTNIQGKFDVIVLTGALILPPSEQLKRNLNVGGRMFVVVGVAPVMQAMLFTRVDETSFKQDILFETCLPHLKNAPKVNQFSF